MEPRQASWVTSFSLIVVHRPPEHNLQIRSRGTCPRDKAMTARNWAPARPHGRGNGWHAVRQGEPILAAGDPADHNCGKSRDARPLRAGTRADPDTFAHPAPKRGSVGAGRKPAAMSEAPGY